MFMLKSLRSNEVLTCDTYREIFSIDLIYEKYGLKGIIVFRKSLL